LRTIPDKRRHLYVTEEIATILDGVPAPTHFAAGLANAKITAFLAGRMMAVSREDRKWKKHHEPDLVKLVGHDEVWELCFRVPAPGWRLFGRFLERGVFVGLVLIDRHEVAGRHDEIAELVKSRWSSKLPHLDPISSTDLDDYVGWVWRNVDEVE